MNIENLEQYKLAMLRGIEDHLAGAPCLSAFSDPDMNSMYRRGFKLVHEQAGEAYARLNLERMNQPVWLVAFGTETDVASLRHLEDTSAEAKAEWG